MGLDALWNDDFHHTARVALTGRTEAYYTDYRGTPQEFDLGAEVGLPLSRASATAGRTSRAARRTWGSAPSASSLFLQNHDQIANSGRGCRVHELTSPGRYRAMTALLLLAPGTPMLFQGQEFAASTPFLYFADLAGELADAVDAGRRRSCRSSRASPTGRGAGRHAAGPKRRATFDRLQARLGASGSATRTPCTSTATCCACAATIRCCGSVRQRFDGAVLSTRCVLACATSVRTGERPPAARQSRRAT